MRERRYLTPEDRAEELKQIATTTIERAKAKNSRLRLLKERNEAYLASRRDELDEGIEVLEQELFVRGF